MSLTWEDKEVRFDIPFTEMRLKTGEKIIDRLENIEDTKGNGVWFADMNEGFNISLPYLQINAIKVRDSKFGTALVVTSTEISGSYILGFRVDPEEKLNNLYKELISLHSIYKNNPVFGVEYKWCSNKSEDPSNNNIVEDVVEIEEPRGEMSNTLAAYLADEGHAKDRPPVYSSDLGLAIESVKEGFSLQRLWEVIPS
ncbi:DUF1448 domain containing protein [Asbolus verrucosus]|uniref:DUF1448 domain containing protein n=1 Tax=Asbolus verrucosus TaxID=1661398 RepID=A0A482VAS9_ASBVE|nr:DUF1448 domain containing protein [Asbolus verrucosus]